MPSSKTLRIIGLLSHIKRLFLGHPMAYPRISTLLLLFFSIPVMANEYFDQSLISVSQYNMSNSMPGTDDFTDEWFKGAFEDEIRYETQEFAYRSPRYKDFSIDIGGLLTAENERERYSAALKWKGIKYSFENGSAKSTFINNFYKNETFVNAGSALPTQCNETTEYDCLERIMINGGEEIEMSFQGQKIQYTFSWEKNIQNVIGYSKYNIDSPILLTRALDPDVSYIGNRNGNQLVRYNDKELWQSAIDSHGKTEMTSLYFGMDASEVQLINAYKNNKPVSAGPVGNVFCMLTNVTIESSGEQEAYLSETYDVEINRAQEFTQEFILSFEYNVGYMVTFMFDPISKKQGFIQAGVRGIFFLSDPHADNPKYESTYVIDQFNGDSYTGYYLTAGATF